MKLTQASTCFSMLFAVVFILLPSVTSAFWVTYLNRCYRAEKILTLSFPTKSIEFDADSNLYTVSTTHSGPGPIIVAKLDAATNYTSISRYAEYETEAGGVNGLAFGGNASLFVSEYSTDNNSGLIREIDTASRLVINTIQLSDFRPTAVAADVAGNIYFPGRLSSDSEFGNVYKIDLSKDLHLILATTIGTGIALDNSGNIFVSTPKRDVSPLVSRSIYAYDATTLEPTLIATFDDNAVEELAFDSKGNLYVLDQKVADTWQTIIRLSPVSGASAIHHVPLLLLNN